MTIGNCDISETDGIGGQKATGKVYQGKVEEDFYLVAYLPAVNSLRVRIPHDNTSSHAHGDQGFQQRYSQFAAHISTVCSVLLLI
jgi:hypothetical protein